MDNELTLHLTPREAAFLIGCLGRARSSVRDDAVYRLYSRLELWLRGTRYAALTTDMAPAVGEGHRFTLYETT